MVRILYSGCQQGCHIESELLTFLVSSSYKEVSYSVCACTEEDIIHRLLLLVVQQLSVINRNKIVTRL